MALGSSQPLTEMSTRSISWGSRRPVRKADNLPPSCTVVMKSGSFNFLETSGPVQACNGTDLPFYMKDCFLLDNWYSVFLVTEYVPLFFVGVTYIFTLNVHHTGGANIKIENKLIWKSLSIALSTCKHYDLFAFVLSRDSFKRISWLWWRMAKF